jgi:hypothetical protein
MPRDGIPPPDEKREKTVITQAQMEERNIIRVTGLLRWGGITKPLPKSDHIKKALIRGSAVHRYSVGLERELVSGGDSAREHLKSWPKNLIPFGHAILKFHTVYQPTFTHTEERIIDEQLYLTGCPDRVGAVEGYRAVVDYKTGREYSWHRLQIALYAILLERVSLPTDIRMCVYLSREGDFRTVIHKANKDIVEACSLIKAYGEYVDGQRKQTKQTTEERAEPAATH